MMRLLQDRWELVSIPEPWPAAWPQLIDANDFPIWATAVVGSAQYVVSNNTRDFPPADQQGRHTWQGIEYLPSTVFLSDILGISTNP